MTKQAATLSSILEQPSFAWLDSLAGPIQKTASAVFNSTPTGRKVKSFLNGTPLRHRVHPALIVVPLGAWTTAMLFDILEGSRNGQQRRAYQTGADTAIAFGIAGAVPSAITGAADWVDLGDHHRRVGMAHALLNNVALVCYGTSLALRLAGKERRGAAKAFAGAGFAAVALSGALGGEMVYTLGTNVPHTLYPKPPDEFRDVLASDALPEGKPVVVEVERVPVMLVRHNGTIHAVQEWCPHAGGPLSRGTLEGDVVECPWHQSRFCLADGKPLQGPATVPLRTFEVREAGGRISVKPSFEGMDWPPAPIPPRPEPEYVLQDMGE